MKKDDRLCFRIASQKKKKLRESSCTYSEIFEMGIRALEKRSEDDVKKRLEYHKKKVKEYEQHLHNLQQEKQQEKQHEYKLLDDLYHWWILADGRTIKNYTEKDLKALKIQLEKRDLTNYSVKYVLRYWRESKGK